MNIITQLNTHLETGNWISWGVAIGLTFLATLAVKISLKFIIPKIEKFSQRTSNVWDDVFLQCLKSISLIVVFLVVLFPLIHIVNDSPKVTATTQALMVLAVSYQITRWVLIMVTQWKEKVVIKKVDPTSESSSAVDLLIAGLKAVLILIIILIALSNLGVDVSALIAGMGIGGIAIALAVQNILTDLFGSISIVLDKPFVVGDVITVGDDSGTVEKIGIKTTRVRAISGEQLIFSNKDLLENRIHNHKRMFKRRVEKRVSILRANLKSSSIEDVSSWVTTYLQKNDKVTLDYFKVVNVDDNYIDYNLVCFISDPSSSYLVQFQERFILDLMTTFDDLKISITNESKNDSRVTIIRPPREKNREKVNL